MKKAILILLALCVICAQAHDLTADASTLTAGEKSGPLGEIDITISGKKTAAVPRDTGEMLLNPGKGFVFMGYMDENDYSEEFRDIVSIGYNRFGWNSIEPEEGEYDWDVIDRFIRVYKRQGKRFAFGVMCANTSKDIAYTTPKWVFDAGARGAWITTDEGVRQMIPDWTDPVFLEKLDDFIEVLAQRYDGDPDIAFIDIRSYGNWGEQHTYKIEEAWPDITAEQLKELYFEPYMEAFKKTLLVAPYGREEYEEVYSWAIDRGLAIRRDGVVTWSDGSEGMMSYGKSPAIFEYPKTYLTQARETGDWKYDEVMSAVDAGAPTYIQIYQDMYESNREFYKKLVNKLGFYFRLKRAEFVNEITDGDKCRIELTLRNDGVAPVYERAALKIGLLDKDLNLIRVYSTASQVRKWMPGEEVTLDASPRIRLADGDTGSGEYMLAVGLFADSGDRTPDYKLGSSGCVGDGWYVFGAVNVKAK